MPTGVEQPPQPQTLECPHCHTPTPHLKSFYFTYRMVGVVIRAWMWEKTVVACPSCMRRILRGRLLANLLTANLLWPALLILYIPRYLATYRPGHSTSLTTLPAGPGRISRFLDRVSNHVLSYIALIVAGFISAYMSFTDRHEELFDASRISLAISLALLTCRLTADVIASK